MTKIEILGIYGYMNNGYMNGNSFTFALASAS